MATVPTTNRGHFDRGVSELQGPEFIYFFSTNAQNYMTTLRMSTNFVRFEADFWRFVSQRYPMV